MEMKISADKIQTRGFGNSLPKIKNPSPTERKQNRRIEIIVD